MKLFTLAAMLWFLYSLTACSGDAGQGTGSDLGSMESLTFPGGDCYTMDQYSCDAFKATNLQRQMNDLAPLTYCQTCYNMSFEQSRDMEARGYFDHNRPEETFAQRVTRFGLNLGAGENLAWGKNGAIVVDMWMNSPSHRAHILDPKFKSFAVATWGLYTTQVFYVGTDK